MGNHPEIIALGKKTSAASYLVAEPTNPQNIYADEGVVSGYAFFGMTALGFTAAVLTNVSSFDGFMVAFLHGLLGAAIGGLVFGTIGFVFSYPQALREEIQKLNIDKPKVSWFDACKMIAWLGSKKTIVSLGTDHLDNTVQAYVNARFGCVTLSQVIAPKATEAWDASAESVVTVYGLTPGSKQEANA